MKIILLQDIAKVGRKNEIKDVNDGFARNFLIGQGRAIVATPANIAKIEGLNKGKNEQQAKTISSAQQLIDNLGDKAIEIKAKASGEGHLFASLHAKDLVAEIKKQYGLDLAEHLIDLPKPLKQLGEHKIALQLGDRQALIKIALTAS
ncbi:MAG: 50S ribosomal protein L9 [Candidatus Vogelbacteria bacterium]|nr:50S ribosomal protein L9 [Candidatus Vogelbacteria bacterium]